MPKYSLYIKEDGYYRINLMNGVVEPQITTDQDDLIFHNVPLELAKKFKAMFDYVPTK